MLQVTVDDILDMISAESIAHRVDIPHDEARGRYRLERNTVDTHNQFHEEITVYLAYHMEETVGPGDMPPFMASGWAREIIDREFRRQGGYEVAYRNARTGRHGGLAASLDAIVKHYKEDQREKFIEHIFYTFVDPMNYEDQIELMQQYLERFGAFLPPEEQTRSAIDLAREWQTLIRTHAEVIGNIQESLRRFS